MKRFTVVNEGYNMEEVNRFIDIVIKRLEKLNNENICFGFYLRSCKYGVVNRYALLDFTKLLTERK